MRSLISLLAVLAVPTLATLASATEPQTRLAHNGKGEVLAVRDLDDAAGPYRAEYSDLDRWYVQHYTDSTTEEERRLAWTHGVNEPWPEHYPADWIALRYEVDAAGWPIPLRRQLAQRGFLPTGRTIRERVLAGANWGRNSTDQMNSRFYFWAAGSLPAELRSQQLRQQHEVTAQDQPLLPAWLGPRPPLQTVFLPNGEILAYGELGLQIINRPDEPMPNRPRGETWYRYSADGQVLQQWPHAEPYNWHALLLDTEPLVQPWRANHGNVSQYHIDGGWWAVVRNEVDPETRFAAPVEVLAAFDYLGDPADLDAPLPAGTRYGVQLDRSTLERLWQAQLALGLVDAQAVSSFEGRPDGPQVADPAPRGPKLLAYRMPREAKLQGSYGSDDMERIEVRPMDDPANPYRDRYQAWDHWMLAQVGARNHKHDMAMNAEMARLAKVKKLKEEGKTIPAELATPVGPMAGRGEMVETDNPWHRWEIAVDAQGYIIPAVEAFQREQAELFAYDYRDYLVPRSDERFHLDAGGEMPEDMRRELEVAKWSTVLDKYPQLPEWLLASPTYKAAVMPNGDIVTQGLPGTWNPDTSVDYEERYRQRDRNYYRFRQDGVLIAQTYLQENEWLVLFSPGFATLIREHETYGYGQHPDAAGFFVVFAGVNGPAVAAYDYDGTQLPVDTPLLRPDGRGRFLRWQELQHLGWAQASRGLQAQR